MGAGGFRGWASVVDDKAKRQDGAIPHYRHVGESALVGKHGGPLSHCRAEGDRKYYDTFDWSWQLTLRQKLVDGIQTGFRANEMRLQFSLLAYNLGNLWRRPRSTSQHPGKSNTPCLWRRRWRVRFPGRQRKPKLESPAMDEQRKQRCPRSTGSQYINGQPPSMHWIPRAWHSATASPETLPVPKDRWNQT
jgi:hypothetical protein